MDTETSNHATALQILAGSSEPGSEEVSVTEMTKTAGKKGKSKVDVLAADPISKAAHTIENLSAPAAAQMAIDLMDGSEYSTFQLGGVFSVVNQKKYFIEYGHPDFKTWVEKVFGVKYRKAMYLVSIYEQVLELQLPWEKIQGLGWTKLKTLLNPALNLVTKDNVDEWVKKADSLTVLQLEAMVAQQKHSGQAIEQDEGKTVTTMTFKLHADQKECVRSALERAKELSGTGVDTVALELICTEFMGKPIVQAATSSTVNSDPATLTDLLKSKGYAAVLEAFETAFPDIELEVTLPG